MKKREEGNAIGRAKGGEQREEREQRYIDRETDIQIERERETY